MALTPNYEFNIPLVGGDRDTWGNQLNDNWTKVDTMFKDANDAIADLDATKVDLTALTDLVLNLIFPVGALHITAQNVNPSTRFPGTTWVAAAAGRAIVGVGTADGMAWTVKQTRGTVDYTLSIGNLPAHTHTVDPASFTATTGGESNDHTHAIDPPSTTTSSNGSHSHGGATGGGGQHNHLYMNFQSGVSGTLIDAHGASSQTTAFDTNGAVTGVPGGSGTIVGPLYTDGARNISDGASHTHSIAADGTHTHTLNIAAFNSGGRSAGHTHNVTINVPSTTSSSVGSGAAFSLVQPSIAYYVWERTE